MFHAIRSRRLLAALALFGICAAGPGRAQTPAIEFTDVNFAGSSGSCVAGYEFTTTGAVIVTDLGYVADIPPAFSIPGPPSAEVGLWDSAGNLLVSTTVTNADLLVGHFRYKTVADTMLASGQNYTVASLIAARMGFDFNVTGRTTPPEISYVAPRWKLSAALDRPTTNDFFAGGNGQFGGSFRFKLAQAVPEPSALAMILGLGAAAGLWALRLRRA